MKKINYIAPRYSDGEIFTLYSGIDELDGGCLVTCAGDPYTIHDLEESGTDADAREIEYIRSIVNDVDAPWEECTANDYAYVAEWLSIWLGIDEGEWLVAQQVTRLKMCRETYSDKAHTDLIEIDSTIFDTISAANFAAKAEWARLTPREQQKCRIYVGVVDAAMLNPDDIEEYGIEEAWRLIGDCRAIVGFDSEDLEDAAELSRGEQ